MAAAPQLLLASLIAFAVGLALVAGGPSESARSAGWAIVFVAAIPLAVATRPRLSERAVRITLVVAVAYPLAMLLAALAPGSTTPAHDGGVWATRAAAEMVVHGEDPYAADLTDELPADWQRVEVDGGGEVDNPIREVYPYLPGAFLVMVPGTLWPGGLDPRLVMTSVFVAAMVLLSRRPEAPWARVAALVASTGPLVALYVAHGSNDTFAASLVVIAALLAARRPRAAGALLALAVSVKFLLVVAVVPFGLWAWRRGGGAELRRWWTFPALLAVTTVPFLIWDPGALVGDTVLFWTGLGDVTFPASGIGLPVLAPDVFHGPVLAVATVVLAALGLAVAVWLVRRTAHTLVLPVATGVAVLGLVVPAETFQANYVALLSGLIAPVWLVVAHHRAGGPTTDAP